MKVIEFNGDYYHANPSKYVAEDVIQKVNKTAKQIWDEDAIKLQAIKNKGFKVLVVWENEINVKDIITWLYK